MMLIDNKFNLGDTVYLKTDDDQKERLITAIQINLNGIIYRLVTNTTETWHYALEIITEKNVLKKINAESNE